MPIEYLRVTFAEERRVLANEEDVGSVNTLLMLPSGEYNISLSGNGYNPPFRHIILAGTSLKKPLIVPFDQTKKSRHRKGNKDV